MNDNQCPTPDRLRRLIDGALPESDMATMRSHVDGCPACQKVLEGLVAGTDSWDMAIGQLRKEGLPVNESPLSEAVRRLKNGNFDPPQTNGRATVSNPSDYLSPSNEPGSIGKLGSYEVTEVIGQGGMGVVLRAHDPTLHRVVAVKVLAPYLAHNPSARKRFVREAQAIAAVSHDHVITIHAIDESAEQPKIVMQYVTGCNLQQKIDNEGSLDLKEILRIAMQTASGLAAAHAQGLVHRDVKPSNILLENGVQRVKLTDFGLARAVDDASLTQSGVISGTPQYMAPEQANGDGVDHRADLFSLGSVMYAMCVGHSPFRASTTMGVLKRVCSDPPRPIQELNPDVPAWLSAIIMKLLAKKPEDRYQSAKEVAELLEHWLACVQQPTVFRMPFVANDPESATVKENSQTIELNSTSTPKRKWWVIPLAILMLIVVGKFAEAALFAAIATTVFIVPLAAIGLIAVFLMKFLKEPLYGSSGETVRPFSERVDQAVNETSQCIRDGWGVLKNQVSNRKSKLNPEQVGQLLSIAWYLCGGIELLTIPFLLSTSVFASTGSWAAILGVPFIFLQIFFGGLATAVGNKIDQKSQLTSIRRYSIIGLLPFSAAALLRIPVAIATLIWTNHSEVIESFQQDRSPGVPDRKPRRTWAAWVRLWFFTGAWIAVWSAACLLAGIAFYIFYAAPYGASTYMVDDTVTLRIKPIESLQQTESEQRSKTNSRKSPDAIVIQASGSGPATGLLPPPGVFVRDKVTVNPGHRWGGPLFLELEILPDSIRYADSGMRFTVNDCENWFSEEYQVADTQYASKFYQLLDTLRRDGGFREKVRDTAGRNLNLITFQDYMRFLGKVNDQKYRRYERTSSVFRTIKSMLGDELFELANPRIDEVITTDCNPAYGFYVVNGIAVVVWIVVSFQLIAWRHRGGGAAESSRTVDQLSSR